MGVQASPFTMVGPPAGSDGPQVATPALLPWTKPPSSASQSKVMSNESRPWPAGLSPAKVARLSEGGSHSLPLPPHQGLPSLRAGEVGRRGSASSTEARPTPGAVGAGREPTPRLAEEAF